MGETFDLREIKRPSHSFVIMETLDYLTFKMIFVVKMKDCKQVKLGRGRNAEVMIREISVSRWHSVLSKSNRNNFFIEDNNSKYGTLLLVPYPIELNLNDPKSIIIGRTRLTLVKRKNFSVFNGGCWYDARLHRL